jgi:hypothetical protein
MGPMLSPFQTRDLLALAAVISVPGRHLGAVDWSGECQLYLLRPRDRTHASLTFNGSIILNFHYIQKILVSVNTIVVTKYIFKIF